MTITLKDGTTYKGADNSTLQEMIVFVRNIDEFIAAYDKMTDENLSEYSVGGETATGRSLAETKTYKYADRIEAHFVVLPTEAQRVIEEMEARAAEYEDKAQAYDILMGEEAV